MTYEPTECRDRLIECDGCGEKAWCSPTDRGLMFCHSCEAAEEERDYYADRADEEYHRQFDD